MFPVVTKRFIHASEEMQDYLAQSLANLEASSALIGRLSIPEWRLEKLSRPYLSAALWNISLSSIEPDNIQYFYQLIKDEVDRVWSEVKSSGIQ